MTLSELVTMVGLEVPLSTEDIARYTSLLTGVEAAIKAYVKWGIEAEAGYTDYHDGNGYMDLILRKPFVTAITDVRVDHTGAYGQGPSAFPASSALVAGEDYALKKEGAYGKSGLLRRLPSSNPYWFPSDMMFGGRGRGLTTVAGPYWPAGFGNIKVVYSYGFATIPEDIKLAVSTAVSIIQNSTKYGWPVQSESLGDYSYSVSISRDTEFGGVRQLLSSYRDVTI